MAWVPFPPFSLHTPLMRKQHAIGKKRCLKEDTVCWVHEWCHLILFNPLPWYGVWGEGWPSVTLIPSSLTLIELILADYGHLRLRKGSFNIWTAFSFRRLFIAQCTGLLDHVRLVTKRHHPTSGKDYQNVTLVNYDTQASSVSLYSQQEKEEPLFIS